FIIKEKIRNRNYLEEKMNFKKITGSIAALTLALSCAFSFPSFADGTDTDASTGMSAKITTASGSYLAGDTVTTDLSIADTPNLSILEIEVSYDTSELEYLDSSWTASLGEDDAASLFDNDGKILLSIESESGFSIGGSLASLSFKALNNGSTAPVSVLINSVTLVGEDDEDDSSDDTDDDVDIVIEDTDDSTDTGQTTVTDTSSSSGSSSGSSSTSSNSASASSRSVDKSYKTGVLFGKDIFLIIALAAGVFAGAFAIISRRKKDK
ncbi:MAG: cohesin domain-containing protein, partial [Lachnospiraceae bacterium]|nr:cohesin domain-containing protein [Lachnospiraceae bacterium]